MQTANFAIAPKSYANPCAMRVLTCARTGREFQYRGFGRPPKYCPEVAQDVRAEQRARAARNTREKQRLAAAA